LAEPIFDSSGNGPSAQEDFLTLALSQREREGVRAFMVNGEAL
jgi:hypothetical protein